MYLEFRYSDNFVVSLHVPSTALSDQLHPQINSPSTLKSTVQKEPTHRLQLLRSVSRAVFRFEGKALKLKTPQFYGVLNVI